MSVQIQLAIYLYNFLNDERCFDPLEEECDDFLRAVSQLDGAVEENVRMRERRKDSRARVVGGGFGLEGAVKGMLTAEGMNLAIGAGHSLVNAIGNAHDRYQAEKLKIKLYDSYKPLLMIQNAFYMTMNNLAIQIASRVFHLPIVLEDIDWRKINSRLNNMDAGLLPNEVARETILNILQADPENQRAYSYKKYFTKEEQKELDKLAEDLDVYHQKAFYDGFATYFSFDSLPQDEVAKFTNDQLEKLKDGDFDTCFSLGSALLSKGKNQDFSSRWQNLGYYALEKIRSFDETGKVAYLEYEWLKKIEEQENPDDDHTEVLDGLLEEAEDKEYTLALRDKIIPLYKRGDRNDARRLLEKVAKKDLVDKFTTVYIASFYLNGVCVNQRDYDTFEKILLHNKNVPGIDEFLRKLDKQHLLGDTQKDPDVAYAVAWLYLKGYKDEDYIVNQDIETGIRYLEIAVKNKKLLTEDDVNFFENALQKVNLSNKSLESLKNILQLDGKKTNCKVQVLICTICEMEEKYEEAEELIFSMLGQHRKEATKLLEKYCVDKDGKVNIHLKEEDKKVKFYQILSKRGNKNAQDLCEIRQIKENIEKNKALALNLLKQRSAYDVKAKIIYRGEKIICEKTKYSESILQELKADLEKCYEAAYYISAYLWMYIQEKPYMAGLAAQYALEFLKKANEEPSAYLSDTYYARSAYYAGSFLVAQGGNSEDISYGKKLLEAASEAGIKEAAILLENQGKKIQNTIETEQAKEYLISLPVKLIKGIGTIIGVILWLGMIYYLFKFAFKILSWIF